MPLENGVHALPTTTTMVVCDDDREVYGQGYELAENFDLRLPATMARAFSHAKAW